MSRASRRRVKPGPVSGAAAARVRLRLRHGRDLSLPGAPRQQVEDGPRVRHVALCGVDHHGLKPRLLVSVGDAVHAGQAVFFDKHNPAVKFVAPGRGEVVAVHRGARRALLSVVIRLEGTEPARVPFEGGALPIAETDRADIAARLCASGLWAAFRARPFEHVPAADSVPAAIFVTAIDTEPLAPDPAVVVGGARAAFEHGLRVLTRLTDGIVYLCTAPGWDFGPADLPRLQRAVFDGPHPAGLAGTHMHALHPVGESRCAWHVGYQDVIAMGRLFHTGELDFTRVVAVAGSATRRPRLVRTRLGAAVDELLAGELPAGDSRVRVISGSPLSGRAVTPETAYLGRYHVQVSALHDEPQRDRFGWWWSGRRNASRTAALVRGHASGMLPLERFDSLLPPGFLAGPLLRALLAGDVDRARDLGCLELAEPDLALCAWACPARSDFGGALRRALERIEREG